MATQSSAVIRWFYTYNNPPATLKPDWIPEELVSWHVYQYEKAPSTGTIHLQGFVDFKSRKRFTALLKDYPGVHWEPRRGSNDQVLAYCTKSATSVEGTEPYVYGGPSSNDIPAEIVRMAKKREYNEISDLYPDRMLRHGNIIKQLADMTEEPPEALTYGEDDPVPNFWVWGPTRSGKTHWAKYHHGEPYYRYDPDTKWWPNYKGEPTVIVDDLSESNAGLLNKLKAWGDRDPFYIEDKGTGRKIRPKRIIITSNVPIDAFPWAKEHREAIEARYTVIHFKKEDRETY